MTDKDVEEVLSKYHCCYRGKQAGVIYFDSLVDTHGSTMCIKELDFCERTVEEKLIDKRAVFGEHCEV